MRLRMASIMIQQHVAWDTLGIGKQDDMFSTHTFPTMVYFRQKGVYVHINSQESIREWQEVT
jgi:hypothetical protein